MFHTMLFAIVTTHSLECTRLSGHRGSTTRLFRLSLLINNLRRFVDDNDLPIVLLLLMLLILLLHNPSRIRELDTLFIWFADAVHLSRISEAAFPKLVTDDFHFVFLIFTVFVSYLGFSRYFRQIHIRMPSEIWKLINCLFCSHLLNIENMFLKLFHIYTRGVVDLCFCGDILEGVKIRGCIISVTNRHNWRRILLSHDGVFS